MRVPEDLWIAGYDDIELASWGAHDLTMVRQPMQQMVGCAIDLLTARIARPAEPLQQVCLPNALVIRSPTARCVFMRT